MDIFNTKKVSELQGKIETLTEETKQIEGLKAEILQVKGYFGGDNTNNEYLKDLTKYIQNGVALLDFSTVDRTKLVNYYKSNAIVRGIVGTTIGNAISELADYIEVQGKDKKVIEGHWAEKVLNKPNDLYNKRKFIKGWAINRMLTGDAFVYGLEGKALSKGQFTELYLLPSQDVTINIGGLTQPIKGYSLPNTYSLTAPLSPKNVMFSREYNTESNTFYGLSPLQSAANIIQLLEKGDKRQNAALSNGGVNNIVTPKPDQFGGVTGVAAENLKQEFNDRHEGNYNSFIRLPIEVHKVGDTPADLALLETSKYAINALCFVYGISVDSFLAQAKYENAKEAKKAVYEQAAIPLMNEFLEDYTAFCKMEEGVKFVLNTDKIEILKAAPTEVMANLTAMGASINEKREYMGYEKRNEPYCDLPAIPLGISLGDPNAFDVQENAPA